jgi:hypothetical protein
MAFSVTDRVKVSNQQNQYRNHLGEVVRIGSGSGYDQEVFVRIDGHESDGEILFKDGDLRASTLPNPITY